MFKEKKSSIKKGLKIIIVGCGKVGATLTQRLTSEGHDITVIDTNPQMVQDLSAMYDVMGVIGNGASYSVQMEADIENSDLIIALTASDELNLLCCTIAKQVGNCAAIARVRNPEYIKEAGYLREKLGLAMIINPELEASNEAARILCMPTALEINTFANGRAEMIKIQVPERNIMDGRTIADINREINPKFLICAVERDGEIFIPSGKFIIRANDYIYFTASRLNAKEFLKCIGFPTQQVKNTMIVGGGKASFYLAKQLITMGIEVKIIESDRARCEELSSLLPEAIIIHGEGTDEELLREEGLEYAQSFVPLTGMDEENIMLTLYAKNISNAKVITKLNKISFKNVINHLDLGSVIYPKYITSEAIIAYVRAKKASHNSNIETLYHFFDFRAEAIEFLIKSESAATNVPLMNLNIKENMLVVAINRDNKIIIPGGSDCIKPGDSVVILAKDENLNSIDDIIKINK